MQELIFWLTGHNRETFSEILQNDTNFEKFFENCPAYQENNAITGKICGCNIEAIENDIMKKIRILDKMVDELAK